ncbi:MAG: hypothetical protein IJL18_01690 [Synergistaceae bacterium]|nr:hypothetical protein [Synergistaceae bacterium]
MLRKLILYFTVAIIILACDITPSSAKPDTGKYKGPLLRMCRIYQLGADEFIVRLTGRNLPAPECSADDDARLSIKLNGSKAYHPEKIKASVISAFQAVPMLYDFDVVNVSDDNSFSVEMEIKSNAPMKVNSLLHNVDGITIRVKSEAKNDSSFGNTFVPPPKTVPSPDTKLPFAVDKRITLELRDAPLIDVVRGIMDYVGRNVVIDPSFPKKIVRAEQTTDNAGVKMTEIRNREEDILLTMTLNDVRADEIMNYLMGAYDLACYVSGVNTLTFGSREGLYKLSGQNSIKQFRIHFAEPEKVRTMLKTLAAIEDSAITVDERMKILYVKTNPAKMQEVEELIGVLDAPEKQVMIRASIFEFSDSDTLTVENALNIAYDDIRISLGGTTGVTVDYRNDRSIRGGRTVWTDRVITDAFSALETKAKGKLLANPSVIAIDGKKAEINLTQDFPYVSARDKDNGTVTWSTEEVGPKLSFTPRVGRDGYVTLTLELSTGDIIGTQTSSTGEQMPVTTTRSVKTDVRVRDGMPFIIGGLFREDESKNVSKIPILGNIPLLGELFTYRYNTKQKSQVVMVITPYVLDSN